MSSSSPSRNNFVQAQAQFLNRKSNNDSPPAGNIRRTSPGPSSLSTRMVGPKPFYRSAVSPDPFDYTNNTRRQVAYQQFLQSQPPRRYSTNQINAIDNDDSSSSSSSSRSTSSSPSDESLSLEFPPPPSAFSTSPLTDDVYQFSPIISKPSVKDASSTPTNDSFVPPIVGRSDSGSSLSNSIPSDHESSSSSLSMHPQYQQQQQQQQQHHHQLQQPNRSTTPTSNNASSRALISVSSTQSPLITIAAGGSPSRSEIRFSSSPQTSKSTVREIRISRPDSPSILINRTGNNPPLALAGNNTNNGFIGSGSGGTLVNGTGGAFHISVGAPTNNALQRDLAVSSPPPTINVRGRTSPASFRHIEMHRDSPDNRYTSNVVANRFKPLMAYTNPNSNVSSFDPNGRRSPAIIALPPASSNLSPSSFATRTGSLPRKEPDVDQLTKLLIKSMNSTNEPNFFGMCARCNDEIVGEENGLVAMDRIYHVSCFTCTMCGCRLRGMHFYSMENKPYCEPCYINSLEKCVVCARPITDRVLRATGKPYHAQCFCCVACRKSLDGIPFTVDAQMQVHCIDCFHQKFAPRCYVCHRTIVPTPGQEETVRIVALDRSYHVECYRCENCKTQFATDQGCYPIDDHIFCLQCNRVYSRTMLGQS